MVDCFACAFRCAQRASGGTQKMFWARYSSGSSGSAPIAFSATSLACCSSKASEMYLRKIRPRTTCLYSAASIEPRRASAICQSRASYPTVAPPVSAGRVSFLRFAKGYLTRWSGMVSECRVTLVRSFADRRGEPRSPGYLVAHRAGLITKSTSSPIAVRQ